MGTEIDGVNGIIKNTTSDGDITIKGNDDGSEISALVFDMSDAGTATFNHDIILGDNGKAQFGASLDFSVYHSGTHSYIENNTGDLILLNNSDDKDILFQSDDGSGGIETYFYVDGSGKRVIFEQNTRHDDNFYASFGSGADLRIYHDGSNSRIQQSSGGTGDLVIENRVSDEDIIFKGSDSGSDFTALTLDMSAAGAATFNAGFTAQAASTITTADNTDTLTLKSTDADADEGPILKLHRDSGSPADGDIIGEIRFNADNDAGEDTECLHFKAQLADASDGSEDGQIYLIAKKDGTDRNRFAVKSDETIFNEDSVDVDFRVESDNNTHALFVQGSSGKVGMGESSPLCSNGGLHIKSGDSGATANSNADELVLESSSATGLSILSGNSSTGNIFFSDDGDNNVAEIQYNHSSNHLAFNVNAGERMRITSAGQVSLGTSSPVGSSRLFFYASASTPYGLITQNDATSGSMYAAQFLQNDGSTELGSIKITNTGTAFNTSSDYRLKENVSYDFDATTRLKQLKPSRFNFIADADTTVDGFLAHEVSSIVPEAISGDKDATETKTKVVVNSSGFVINQDVEEAEWTAGKVADDNGNTRYPTDSTWEASKVVPVYQGIDQSKLVPLMVKTIQELEARITTLEG